MGDTFPKFKAAAIQAAPVLLDREATVEKACRLIEEAGSKGARLIAFPEVYIPAYPWWNRVENPYRSKKYFRELVKNSVEIPSASTDRICQAARRAGAYVVMGVNERVPETLGTLYNTNFVVDPRGKLLGYHRKLVPTFLEKVTWGGGDGHTLKVYDTEIGKLGTLCCGENTNPLARFAHIAQGEQVHVANYPGQPAGDDSRYDLTHAIEIRSAAHAFEGKLFNVVSCGVFTKEIAEVLGDTEEKRKLMSKGSMGLTAIYGPDGKKLAGPVDPNQEGMAIAEIDIELIIDQKLQHDIVGHYNRFDVLSLNLNRRALKAIRESGPADEEERDEEEAGEFGKTSPRPGGEPGKAPRA
ncbi:MAG TPA: carbon-nitrogen hydrolase family protein [Thermodesulfobacteriota bacterium]|nr:carbon-nitrogen hydrolase family protein [Thermodesulfobacteriota bacterium]